MFARWTSPEAVFQHPEGAARAASPATSPASTTTRMLDERGGIQWPLPEGADRARERASAACSRTAGSITPDGRARFVFDEPAAAARAARRRSIPFMLLTGRGSSAQWHTQTRTAKSRCPAQARTRARRTSRSTRSTPTRLGIGPSDWVRVRSRARRTSTPRAFVTHAVQPGQVFMPDALQHDQPADVRRVRSVLAPALVQALRRAHRTYRSRRSPSCALRALLRHVHARPTRGTGCVDPEVITRSHCVRSAHNTRVRRRGVA